VSTHISQHLSTAAPLSTHWATPALQTDDLTALEARYGQTIIDQYATLTFKGLAPSSTLIALPLENVYVELKAVVDVPEAADTYSAEERRLLLNAERQGTLAREELAMHLDALRAER
jgi:hypothetical protein